MHDVTSHESMLYIGRSNRSKFWVLPFSYSPY